MERIGIYLYKFEKSEKGKEDVVGYQYDGSLQMCRTVRNSYLFVVLIKCRF